MLVRRINFQTTTCVYVVRGCRLLRKNDYPPQQNHSFISTSVYDSYYYYYYYRNFLIAKTDYAAECYAQLSETRRKRYRPEIVTIFAEL